MNTIEKMKRISVLQTQAENAQKNLEEINDLSQDHFLKFAEPSELDDLRAKVKARYEGYLKEIMDEAQNLLGEHKATSMEPAIRRTMNGPHGVGRYSVPISKIAQFKLELEHCEKSPFKDFAARNFEEVWYPYKLFLP